MFWADEIAQNLKEKKVSLERVDDMKTPSGYAHIGSLLGPVIHSCIYRAVKNSGRDAQFTFVINDFDPADDLLPELRGKYEQYLGMPLKLFPSPDPKYESMADLFGSDFINAIQTLGVEAKILSSWELYHEGKFDEVIRIALDNSEKIQDIYQKVSGSKKKEKGWLPFQVICQKCQKLGTTRVFDWDGKEVSYTCEPSMVTWAQGCGHSGKMSPYGGNGKLPWKVDWAAHWVVLGVTVEGAGKDHASAGGSYDIAMSICEEVFNYPKPYKLPYEFLLIGGRKMSSSKGIGLKAHDVVKILPPSVGRFLFVGRDIKSQSNFDPEGTMAIPDLFDDYDKAWQAYNGDLDEQLSAAFVYAQIDEAPKKQNLFLPRFRDVANFISMPNIDLVAKFSEIKGEKLNDRELEILKEREKYAKIWLERYAPEEDKFIVLDTLPEKIKDLSVKQKEYLKKVSDELNKDWQAEDFQKRIYELSKEMDIKPKDAFSAIYTVLLGKDHGPKAGWLILSLDKDFIKKRFEIKVTSDKLASRSGQKEIRNIGVLNKPEIFSIDKNLAEKFPSISVGVAVIKDVSIEKSHSELEKEKEKLLESLKGLTTEQLGQYEEVVSYRKLYKATGVDWHSRRPSPEALLRRVALNKGLYTINTCVDAYNLVVMKNRVSIGAFDYDALEFPTMLRMAKNGEKIHLLGDEDETEYQTGEIAYFDSQGGFNIDFNYRDAQRTAVQLETKNVYVNVDGVFDITPEMVERSLKEACEVIIKYCGGTLEVFGVESAS